MGNTKENLAAAFAGESQANRKYLAFSKKAKEDGYLQIAKLFKAAAKAETVHAHNHLRVMDGVRTTTENVAEAISGETYEFKKMYPEFLEVAEKEDEKLASWTFNVANEVEKIHAEMYLQAQKALEKGEDLPSKDIFVCDTCGNTVHKVPERCPICGVSKDHFIKIE